MCAHSGPALKFPKLLDPRSGAGTCLGGCAPLPPTPPGRACPPSPGARARPAAGAGAGAAPRRAATRAGSRTCRPSHQGLSCRRFMPPGGPPLFLVALLHCGRPSALPALRHHTAGSSVRGRSRPEYCCIDPLYHVQIPYPLPPPLHAILLSLNPSSVFNIVVWSRCIPRRRRWQQCTRHARAAPRRGREGPAQRCEEVTLGRLAVQGAPCLDAQGCAMPCRAAPCRPAAQAGGRIRFRKRDGGS